MNSSIRPPFVALVPNAKSEIPKGGKTADFTAIASASASPQGLGTAAQGPHPTHVAPKITVQREGDRITQIEIHCSCNEVIRLDCVY